MSSWDFKAWVWTRATAFFSDPEGLERELVRSAGVGTGYTWQPPVDIFESRDAVWLFVALPGVDPARVEVVLEERRLSVRGVRSLPPLCQRAVVHRMELPCGAFERSIEIPPGRFDLGTKEFINGCLTVEMKKVV